jgi:hypothetical protein
MMNAFANETIYGGWKREDCVNLKEAMPSEMYDALDPEATVTESDEGYGKSVCFTMHGGTQRMYKPLSKNSKLNAGDKLKVEDCYVVELSKPGMSNIYRISETKE